MNNKFQKLQNTIENLGKQGICLAFSSGIDSTLLLYLCRDKNLHAVTFSSIFQPEEETALTKQLCKRYNIKHKILELNPLDDESIKNNPKDRCYHCKKMFFEQIKAYAAANNLENIFDGTNYDDLKEYRPGLKALKELNIISPFAEHKITKAEIRLYAKECGINIFDKPSTPCLATRFPYGTLLEASKIKQVKTGENILKNNGFLQNRLRMHGDVARIEIEKDKFAELLKNSDKITQELKSAGFHYLTLDLEGFRSGSMDR